MVQLTGNNFISTAVFISGRGTNLESLIRDLDAVINKLNTSFQEEVKQEIEARSFFLE